MQYFKLIKNANLYTPEKQGISDILIYGGKVAMIDKKIEISGLPVEVFDAQGMIVTPGFIDRHVHVIGGGGQQGYASLAPEVTMSELIKCGTTTVLGLLGTDGYVKDLSTLYAKTKALCQDGLSAYMLTSFYGFPPRVMTGSVAEDMIYIYKVIGCKLAMSDDRSSFPTKHEIMRLINQIRLGGFTSGKGGFLHIHIGNLTDGIELLIEIAHEFPSLTKYISPTHMIRTEQLFNQAIEYAKLGGTVDFSTGGTCYDMPNNCVIKALEQGVPIDRITFSSDGHGGVRRINPKTGEISYRPAPLELNFKETMALVKNHDIPLEQALTLITSNPAIHMNLHEKGRLAIGKDADVCMLNDDLSLMYVISRGEFAMKEGKIIKKGRYEL